MNHIYVIAPRDLPYLPSISKGARSVYDPRGAELPSGFPLTITTQKNIGMIYAIDAMVRAGMSDAARALKAELDDISGLSDNEVYNIAYSIWQERKAVSEWLMGA